MKFLLIALSIGFLGVSCERHDFSETRKLHEPEEHEHEAGPAEPGHDSPQGEPAGKEHAE
ncbi:hypothetical protein JIN85_04620 [Luteolibacter pohnpeiensis]|uniref:Uncharacterized protein n=1 Tax=Luteolibacter pohnpeiensis TaxID=454153 RepID=A0A934S5S3_9BACT|nr:hypothetical protein [Luteolibacter pohnpeiensis]MBK1881684.1 hypothetical protein [Luteolibacter pohnpeiensis]